MGQTKIIAYHGTDQSVVNDIMRNGFRCKPNKEHWLGEGIPPCYNEQYANNMHIMYAEIQVCVRETAQNLIKDKVVHMLKGGEQYAK